MIIQPVFRSVFQPVLQGVLGNPIGPAYVTAGRVLDYSTAVGPFTIVDQSPEGNDATLYSGRGVTLDGASNLIDFGSPTFSEPVTSVTGQARSLDTSINLGLTAATLEGSETWESFSADTPAKDYGDARWFNGTSTYVSHDTGSTSATFFANKTISAKFILGSTAVQAIHVRGATAERLYVTGGGNFGVGGSTDTGFSVSAGVLYHTELDIDATGKIVELRVNGNTEWTGSVTELVSMSTFYIGARDAGGLGLFLNGTAYDVSITSYLAYTGLGTSVTAWLDTIGSNNGTESGAFESVSEYYTNPDFILGASYDGDLSDVRCLGATGTVLGHWALADWSDPNADGLNGKTIVDSGANDYHGTCTGCAGFTGEGIDPEVAGIVGLDDEYWFDGVDDTLGLALLTLASGTSVEFKVYYTSDQNGYVLYQSGSYNLRVAVSASYAVRLRSNAVNYDFGASSDIGLGRVNTVRLENVGGSVECFINGVSKGVTAVASSFRFDEVNSTALPIEGMIYDVMYNDSSVVFTSVNGSPVTVGQKRATIPQTADRNWNKYQWFNGVDTEVSMGLVPSLDNKEISITFSWDTAEDSRLLNLSVAVTSQLCVTLNSTKNGTTALVVSDNSGSYKLGIDTTPFNRGDLVTLTVTTGNFPTFVSGDIEGIPLVVGIDADGRSGNGLDSVLGCHDGLSTVHYSGSICNFTFNDSFAYTGLGNNPWKDTIGSNDGTESGTFTRELVSASDADDQIDALGTAILEPRLNNQQLNFFGEGEYSRTADSDSLDLTTAATWEIWGNFYGAPSITSSVLSKWGTGKRAYRIVKIGGTDGADQIRLQLSTDGVAVSNIQVPSGIIDGIQHLVISFETGTMNFYVNGALIHTATPAVTIFASDASLYLGEDPEEGTSALTDKIGSPKIYNVALTADEVLQNFNAQKSKYGL